MKLKEFIICLEKEFEDFVNIKVHLDIGINTNMDVNGLSKNRIQFSILKKKSKEIKK